MEEIQENTIQEPTKRKQAIYSPEMKIRLLNEYKSVIGKVTMSQFAKEHELSVSTFFGWLQKSGINASPLMKAIDVRSMIPIENQTITSSNSFKQADSKPTMIPIILNGNELLTTPDGIGLIISSLKICSR